MDFRTALSQSTKELETLYRNKEDDENAAIYLAQKELLISLGNDSQTLTEFEEKVEEVKEEVIETVTNEVEAAKCGAEGATEVVEGATEMVEGAVETTTEAVEEVSGH